MTEQDDFGPDVDEAACKTDVGPVYGEAWSVEVGKMREEAERGRLVTASFFPPTIEKLASIGPGEDVIYPTGHHSIGSPTAAMMAEQPANVVTNEMVERAVRFFAERFPRLYQEYKAEHPERSLMTEMRKVLEAALVP